LLVILSPAFGSIPSDIKNGTEADKPAQKAQIVAAIQKQVELLKGSDLEQRGKARDGLINELNPVGNQKFNATFLDVYAMEIDKQLTPLATDTDVRIRLNVAIIVKGVAEKSENTRLLNITELLMDDKSDAVLMWAVRAAGCVLPPLLQAGVPEQQKKLLLKIKESAKNPALIGLAYEALTLNYLNWKAVPANLDKVIQLLFPELIGLMEQRGEMLRTGKDMAEPSAERVAMNFLVNKRIWDKCTDAQRLQTVQVILNDLSFAGHRAVLPGADKEQLTLLVRGAGLALGAAGQFAGDATATTYFTPFRNIDPNAAKFLHDIDDVLPHLQQTPALKGLKAPSKIETSPGTQPSSASAPATAPGSK
jgi:hypothetical protein